VQPYRRAGSSPGDPGFGICDGKRAMGSARKGAPCQRDEVERPNPRPEDRLRSRAGRPSCCARAAQQFPGCPRVPRRIVAVAVAGDAAGAGEHRFREPQHRGRSYADARAPCPVVFGCAPGCARCVQSTTVDVQSALAVVSREQAEVQVSPGSSVAGELSAPAPSALLTRAGGWSQLGSVTWTDGAGNAMPPGLVTRPPTVPSPSSAFGSGGGLPGPNESEAGL
jgi:hypothetical protein